MSKIVIDRSVVEQAAERLAEIHPGNMTPMAEESWSKAIAALRAALTGAAEYAEQNPLGGPAKVFDAMADAIRAGDDYHATLRRYGFAEVKDGGALEQPVQVGCARCPRCWEPITAPDPRKPTRDEIRSVFLANGFTVKEGQTDLKDYVYAAAYALLAASGVTGQPEQGPVQAQQGWDVDTLLDKPKQEPAGINGLTESETNATASVAGLVGAKSVSSPEPVAWAEEIIANLHALHDSELIREVDSGDALIRLESAIATVEEAEQRHIAPTPRKQLTWDQIEREWAAEWYPRLSLGEAICIVRWAEQQHGITGEGA